MRLTHALLALLLVQVARPTTAQDTPPNKADVVDRIVDEALTAGQAYRKLRALCAVAPHRLSGSRGAEAAVAWARAAMIADGLENVRLEPCIVPRWERGDVEELVLLAEDEVRLPILALGGSIATPEEGIEAELVIVQSFEELLELGEGARGKIVLFNRPMDDRETNTFRAYGGAVGQRARGAIEAARAGGVAALVRSMTTRRDDVPHTGAMRYEEGVERIPTAAVSTNAADDLARRMAAGESLRLRLRLSCRWYEPVTSYNVVGELVGREKPEEVIVLGGHLDAWDVGHGAHDDGSGCVQAMEALRLLKSLDLRPRRTLRCVLFMNEENGLGGGRAYHEDHLEEMEQHVLAIESDRGGFTPRGFSVQGSDQALAELRALAPLFERTGAVRVEPGGGGADIGPMSASGVPLVGFVPDSQRYFDVHHSANDVVEAVHPRELHLGAAAMAALAWLVAEREEPLPRVELEKEQSEGGASDRE